MSQRTEPRNKADGACADGTAAVTMRRGGGACASSEAPRSRTPKAMSMNISTGLHRDSSGYLSPSTCSREGLITDPRAPESCPDPKTCLLSAAESES